MKNLTPSDSNVILDPKKNLTSNNSNPFENLDSMTETPHPPGPPPSNPNGRPRHRHIGREG